MAITITAKLDASGVKSGAEEASAAVGGLGNSTESASEQMQAGMAGTFDELKKLKGEIEELQSELDQMGKEAEQSFGEVGGGAADAGGAVKSIGGGATESRDKIKTVAVAYLAVVDVVKKVGEFAKKAGEAIAWMAENGNPAAIELQESFKGVKHSILDIAEDPAFQDVMAGLAVTIREDVIPAIQAIPDAWVATEDFLEDGFASLGESVGLFAEGTREAMDEMQAADAKDRSLRQNRLAGQKEERASKNSLAKIEEALAGIEKARSDDAVKSALDQIKTEEELRDVIDDMTESLREQAKVSTSSEEEEKKKGEEIKRRLSGIVTAENRIKEIKAEAKKEADEAHTEAVAQFKERIDLEGDLASQSDSASEAQSESASSKAIADAEKTRVASLEETRSSIQKNTDAWLRQGRITREQAEQSYESIRVIDEELATLRESADSASEKSHEEDKKRIEEKAKLEDKQLNKMRSELAEKKKLITPDTSQSEIENTRALEREISKRSRAIEKWRDEEIAKINKVTEEEKKAHDERLKEEKEAIERRKKLLEGGPNGNVAQGVVDAQTPEQIKKKLAENRAAEAERRERERLAQSLNSGDEEERKAAEKRVTAVRKSARNNASREFDRGQIGGEEFRAAQEDLANATIEQARSTTGMSGETVSALKEATSALIKNQNETDRVAAEVENLKSIIVGSSRQSERRRAQVAGSRQ